MGNFFHTELECELCKKENKEPEYFTKENNPEYTSYIRAYISMLENEKYDKYGRKIIKKKESIPTHVYRCSNGHTVKKFYG